MRKLRLRAVEGTSIWWTQPACQAILPCTFINIMKTAQSHTSSKWERWNSNPGFLISWSVLSPFTLLPCCTLLIMKHCLRNPSELESWDCPLLSCSLLRSALAMLLRHCPEGSVDTQAQMPFSSYVREAGATHYFYHFAGSNFQQCFARKKMNQFNRTLFLLPKEMVPVNRWILGKKEQTQIVPLWVNAFVLSYGSPH